MASPDPDPSYVLDEFEMAFAKKVLGLAVEARKIEMQYQRRHEYREMTFDDLIQFREDMRRKAEEDQEIFRTTLALPKEGVARLTWQKPRES